MGDYRLPKRVMSKELENAGKRGPGGRRNSGQTAWQMIFGDLESRGTRAPPHLTLGSGGGGQGCTWGDCSNLETLSSRVDWTNSKDSLSDVDCAVRENRSPESTDVVDAMRLGTWLRSGEGIGWLAAGTLPNSFFRVPFFYLFLACIFCYRSFIFAVFVLFFALVGALSYMFL